MQVLRTKKKEKRNKSFDFMVSQLGGGGGASQGFDIRCSHARQFLWDEIHSVREMVM